MKELTVQMKLRTSKEGRTFPTYKVRKKDGTWIRMKIRKDTTEYPKTEGWYTMSVDENNVSISDSDYGDVLWVGGETTCKPFKRDVDPRFNDEF